MTYARLSAIYGLSFADISTMPMSAINAYITAIPAILAMWQTVSGEGALLPWTKNPSQILERWNREAYGAEATAVKATPGMLKLIGIGVRHV